ncbi:hypothetical protein LSAT2_029494 [Lamellibrachia satsuma]|nr:hypothetical protein LSAT2_029494 [Lamellibrachia satsuma]
MDLSEFNCVEGAKPTTKFLHSHAWSDRQETPSSICLSPYLVGECAVATANGSVFLWSSDGRFDAVCKTIKSRFSGVENWCSCHYGAHPREIVVSDRTGVSLFDIRQPAHTVGMDLFILPNRLMNPAERIMVSTQHAKNTFLHAVATDYNLMLIDERFPSSPVIHWRHTLRSPPQYIDTISGLVPATSCDQCLGDDLILLASQTSHETHCFQLTLGQPSQPPQATVTPWRVSQAEDLVHLSRVDGILTDHSLLSRLSVSLVGMCAFPHPAGNGCTIFQVIVNTIQDKEGKYHTEEKDVINRWTEYCSELYNFQTKGDHSVLARQESSNEDDFPILHKEVEIAIRSLKNGKAVGNDNIPAELLKKGGEAVIDILTNICNKI